MHSYYLVLQCPDCLAMTCVTTDARNSLPPAIYCGGCGGIATITHIDDIPDATAVMANGTVVNLDWLILRPRIKVS
jgi:hypothetical protein